ncbi:cysteine--tRNA ligase [Pseudoxanthomonas kalamensis DSM 18571]|uniref:cysteine--tRNA ligase n=1 Tax=Pseudoxanthomonas kalamensis TaxID=289483 RepID=UPI0013913364|nr:cysteine--tRNA ligase [Pseudoxanthomonas kalamensis]KAF1710439.1 cysteine--tRNA ligase [Pseudoxanthomonas kalamensis DSM 18571]
MPLRLHNNLTRRVEPFEPQDPACPTMYVCGPTVYNYVHIGNARGPVVFGVLAALLRRRYGALRYARNITDVDDKINAAAREQGVPISAITDRFAEAYRQDMAGLGVTGEFAPDLEPAATAHIPQIVAMIQRLIDSGHAYTAEGHVLFSVDSFPDYGKLSGRDPEEMLAGARVEVAPYKRDPGDFVLWKPSGADLPGWDSPWGRGRPGWHIECSAMAGAHLGDTIDIHAGGVDLQFPHHENEIAQSECAHGGATFARFWLHNGMLNFGGAKMSKSLGNIETVHDLLAKHPPEALRYALLSAHYRQPLDWNDALIEQSLRTLDRLYGTLRDLADVEVEVESVIPQAVEDALDDDLNTPQALAEVARIAAEARKAVTPEERRRLKAELLGAGRVLGLLQQDWIMWFQGDNLGSINFGVGETTSALDLPAHLPNNQIERLIEERTAAKKARDFARADAIREQLAGEGILIEDTPQGTRWKRA